MKIVDVVPGVMWPKLGILSLLLATNSVESRGRKGMVGAVCLNCVNQKTVLIAMYL